MKRIIAHISILAAVLTAGVSCTREAIDGSREGNEISLTFVTEEMSTKVTVNDGNPVAGVGAENTIEYVDFYIPAVVGDAKKHTWSNGIIQTYKAYPNGAFSSVGGNFNGKVCVEFIGYLDGKLNGLGTFSIVEIRFYDS